MSDLCSGCGVCAALCPVGARTMAFDDRAGMFLPRVDHRSCTDCGLCQRVCPFAPGNPPTPVLTERLFAALPGVQHHEVLGYYLATHVGYSEAHRPTSASGGLATWLLERLLSSGAVDAVLCVGHDAASPTLFSYRACRSVPEVRDCSGSCYQPVHLGEALAGALHAEGRYAVVALPCVARALRLAMAKSPRLRSRVRYVVGLVCGQMKSRHFVEYLCARRGSPWPPSRIAFRTKRPGRPASDYAYALYWDGAGGERRAEAIGWADGLGRDWSRRLFTLEACEHCDDVFAECADMALMDAWLPEYSGDWHGHSLAIVRGETLGALLQESSRTGVLALEDISADDVLESQCGAVRQKRVLNLQQVAEERPLRALARRAGPGDRLDAWLGREMRARSSAAWAAAPGDLRRLDARLRPLVAVEAARSLGLRAITRLRRATQVFQREGLLA